MHFKDYITEASKLVDDSYITEAKSGAVDRKELVDDSYKESSPETFKKGGALTVYDNLTAVFYDVESNEDEDDLERYANKIKYTDDVKKEHEKIYDKIKKQYDKKQPVNRNDLNKLFELNDRARKYVLHWN